MSEIWTNLLNMIGLAWWVEVVTEAPRCTYYFGPFPNEKEANLAKGGYVEDVEKEGAQGIKVSVKCCKPSMLTIYEDGSDAGGRNERSPAFSGQI